MVGADRRRDLRQLLLSPSWLQAKLAVSDASSLNADFDYVPDDEDLSIVQGAVRLSSNVIAKDPGQFASQIVGRLLPYQNLTVIAEFSKRTAEGAHGRWLRSTQPALHPPGIGLLRTLTGHSGWVTGVAVTPDGQRAVSASDDNTLKVWELSSGRELHTLSGHAG